MPLVGSVGKVANHDFAIWTGTKITWQVVTWSKDYIGGWTNQDLKPFLQKPSTWEKRKTIGTSDPSSSAS